MVEVSARQASKIRDYLYNALMGVAIEYRPCGASILVSG